jgi:hypothetical protein
MYNIGAVTTLGINDNGNQKKKREEKERKEKIKKLVVSGWL